MSVRVFFALARVGDCTLVSSGNAVDEARRNIRAAAIDAKCDLLATRDRTLFGELLGKRVRGTTIVLPVEAIEILVGPA